MRIPILAYEPNRILGNDYATNALHALAADLDRITRAGFKVVPLHSVVEGWLSNARALDERLVCITCEHGTDFDFRDLPHPTAGLQRNVHGVLQDFQRERPGEQESLHATSFVIASAAARAELDRSCMIGQGWWSDNWWKAALESGLLHIANNSWDYNHDALPECIAPGAPRGTFATISNRALADHEIRRAAEHLRNAAPNPGTQLFAYPYGEANAYLADEYFPTFGEELGIKAAFTARGGFLEPGVSRWAVPRFLNGRHWNDPTELDAILDAAAGRAGAWIPVSRRPVPEQPAAALDNACSATDSSSAEGFRARFEAVPSVLADWMEGKRRLAGLDILDFGCGEGVSALALALHHGARRVVGVDIMPDVARCLPIARAHLGLEELPDNLRLYRVAPGDLHDAEERFDLVYSWSVFEHVDQRLLGSVLRRIRSSLRTDGRFLVQIAPLYYSPEGSHLHHRIAEPWAHLLWQDSILEEKLAAATRDSREFDALWGTYRTLNRITAAQLADHLEANGFEILRSWAEKDPRPPPEPLRAIYREDVLRTRQVVMLARPA